MVQKKNLDIFSFDPSSVTKQNKVTTELSPFIKKENIYASDAEIVSSAIKQKSFLIALLGPQSINPAKECIDAFSMGKQGLLLIHNYAIEKSPNHHLYAVERGLRIIEQPDGSGSVSAFKKTPARGRVRIWRIYYDYCSSWRTNCGC